MKGLSNIIWGAVMGAICFAIVGLMLPFVLQFLSCTCNLVSCNLSAPVAFSDANSISWAQLGALLGAIAGALFGVSMNREEAKKAEEEEKKAQREAEAAAERERRAKEAAEQQRRREEELRKRQQLESDYSSWDKALRDRITRMVSGLEKANADAAGDDLAAIWKSGERAKELDSTYNTKRFTETYEHEYGDIEGKIVSRVKRAVSRSFGGDSPAIMNLETILTGSSLMLAYRSRDSIDGLSGSQAAKILGAIQSVRNGVAKAKEPTIVIRFPEYGQADFSGVDPRGWSAEKAEACLDDLRKRMRSASNVRNGHIECVSSLDGAFFDEAARLMWYFSDVTPFNVEKFDEVRSAYNAFTAETIINDGGEFECLGKVEEVLARLYAKNKLGGASTARQEEPYMMRWVEHHVEERDTDPCFVLVSGLAWLELFDFEQKTLKYLVAHQVQLTAELQERLGVLESGRTMNVRLFDVEPTSEFVFDSSSVDWNYNEFSAFFRKLTMRKSSLSYSLALSKWSRALPLKRGQKVSSDDLYHEFQEMVLDFDGEVACRRTDARAVDLNNLLYPGAVLFSFLSERSRCVSVLFYSEKYGRNLNVTIYTLFTPEDGMAVSDLERYAAAAKGNIYMDSFRESILQSIDDVLKVEKSIYEDDDDTMPPTPGRRVIE